MAFISYSSFCSYTGIFQIKEHCKLFDTPDMTDNNKPKKIIHILLWIAQIILAAIYLMAGTMKLLQPIEKLSQKLPWAADVSEGLVRFIGISEFLGSLGLLLPAILRIQTKLTPIAAIGLVLIQVFAIIFHISRGEAGTIGINIALLLIAAFIAWGRFYKVPIQPKV
jgi:putative oxidoreductase